MDSRNCQECGEELTPAAKFCPECGKGTPGNSDRGALSGPMAGTMLAFELFAMAITAFFSGPKLLAAFGPHGPRSHLIQTVFAPWFMPSFMLAVLVIGGLGLFAEKLASFRTALVIAALTIGFIPMAGTYLGIMFMSVEVADTEANIQ